MNSSCLSDSQPTNQPISPEEIGQTTNIPITSDLPLSSVNPTMPLYRGRMTLTINSVSVSGEGIVYCDFSDDPTITWQMTFRNLILGTEINAELTLDDGGLPNKAKVIVLGSRFSSSSLEASANGIVVNSSGFEMFESRKSGRPESVGCVKFYVSNLNPFWWQSLTARVENTIKSWLGRLRFSFGPWEVTLDSATDVGDLLRLARASGGYAITHVGVLKKKDDGLFPIGGYGKTGLRNAKDALEALYWFLSFINGAQCGIVLPKGLRRNPPYVFWQQWSVYKTDRAESGYRWPSDYVLAETFLCSADLFYTKWEDPIARDWLHRAIALYLGANRNALGIDIALTISQNALELVSWVAMMEENQLISEDSFEKLPAADKLRLLLFWLKVSPTIPEKCGDLQKAFPKADAPKATTDLRNWLIHPTRRNRESLAQTGLSPVVDAWYLNMWYLELTILKLLGYTGQYSNRLAPPFASAQSVPWV